MYPSNKNTNMKKMLARNELKNEKIESGCRLMLSLCINLHFYLPEMDPLISSKGDLPTPS